MGKVGTSAIKLLAQCSAILRATADMRQVTLKTTPQYAALQHKDQPILCNNRTK